MILVSTRKLAAYRGIIDEEVLRIERKYDVGPQTARCWIGRNLGFYVSSTWDEDYAVGTAVSNEEFKEANRLESEEDALEAVYYESGIMAARSVVAQHRSTAETAVLVRILDEMVSIALPEDACLAEFGGVPDVDPFTLWGSCIETARVTWVHPYYGLTMPPTLSEAL